MRALRDVPDHIRVLAVARFLLAMGEELWVRYMPRYLQALGASVLVVGLWGSLWTLVEAAWQYPGGALSDKLGRRRAVLWLTALGIVGLLLFLTPYWPAVLVGLVFYGAATGYGGSATQSVVSSSVPKAARATAFAVMAVMRKPTALLGPPIAGLLIASQLGLLNGVRVGLAIAVALFLGALWLQARKFPDEEGERNPRRMLPDLHLGALPRRMRWLLLADTLARIGERVLDVFAVLYVVNVLGYSDLTFGLLVGLGALLSLLGYLPLARWSDRTGRRRPLIAFTFLMLAAYPLLLASAPSLPLVIAAFTAFGLKEVTDPARKALVSEMAPEGSRGHALGIYNAVRAFAVLPAPLLAALVWESAPRLVLYTGGALALLGIVVLYAMVRDEPRRAPA